MTSVSDDAIHEVRRGLRQTSATRRVDWPEDHACGSAERIGEMGTSERGDRTCTKRLGVYIYAVYNVNKCIKNNDQFREHSGHATPRYR